jgi:hypothetical protein
LQHTLLLVNVLSILARNGQGVNKGKIAPIHLRKNVANASAAKPFRDTRMAFLSFTVFTADCEASAASTGQNSNSGYDQFYPDTAIVRV